jgi:hypothetical protein
MTLLKFLVGLLLAGSFDIAFGVFFAHLSIKSCHHFGHPLFTYLFGVFFALLPDVDALAMKIFRGKIMADHRDWPHWPILIIPAGAAIWYFSPFYAVLAGLCLLEHYVHDSLNIKENDMGIRWFAPFNQNYYLISWRRIKNAGIFARLSKRRINKIRGRRETIDRWLEKHYLHPTVSSMVGGMLLAFTIILAIVWQ